MGDWFMCCDGATDIFAAIDFAANHLWINQGDSTFVDIAESAGVDHAWNDMGVTLGDYDGDADLDDFQSFHTCVNGPSGGPITSPCRAFDAEPDGDVDWADFALFQMEFGGQTLYRSHW